MKKKTNLEKVVNAILAFKKKDIKPSYAEIARKVQMSGEGVRQIIIKNRIKK